MLSRLLAVSLLLAAVPAAAAPQVFIKARAGAVPGDILLIVVQGQDASRPPAGRFGTESLCFWRAATGTYLAFAGLDLEASTGTRTMELELRDPDGVSSAWKEEIVIAPKDFPEQRLRVPPEYVTLSPANERRARSEAARLKELYSWVSAPSRVSGNFREPLAGRVSAAFGERRVFNRVPKSPHGGVDIAAPKGARVLAPQDGRVVLAADLFYSGRTVVLDHGCGLFTFYGHLSKISVKQGDSVERGKVLGRVGATGRATGPHLHWTLRLGPARLDPFSLSALDLDKFGDTILNSPR